MSTCSSIWGKSQNKCSSSLFSESLDATEIGLFGILIFMFFAIFRAATWVRVSVWLLIGVVVYVFYGRSHSSLLDAVYVPAAHADEIYRSSGDSLA